MKEMEKNHLKWWDGLRKTNLGCGQKDRGYYTNRYFGYNMRMHKYLSDEEIKAIYKNNF